MKFNANFGVLLLALSLTLFSGIAVSGLLTTSVTLSSSGSVKAINVEVYWDSACTQVVSSLDWGAPNPGDSVTRTVYIKNTGNAQLALSMYHSGWSPNGAENYLTLSWNREGTTLNPDQVIQAVLTLDVSSSITGINDFSFNIVIEGTG